MGLNIGSPPEPELNDPLDWLSRALGSPLICVDVETTGGNPERDRIIEIGVLRIEPGGRRQEWSTLVRPDVWLPPGITALTGIHPEDLVSAPRFEEIHEPLRELLRDAIFVAHNARFDLGFVRQSLRRCGADIRPRVLCTVRLSRRLFPGVKGHALDAIMARHGLACTARHRALGDARVVADFLSMLATRQPETLVEACQAQWSLPSLPPHLPADSLDELPERAGVYLFYGDNDLPLYIGKAGNLRRRVLDHFRGDHRHAREMRLTQQTRRIDWIETAGELGALLLEAQLIKRHSPILNRRLRRLRELVTIRWKLGEGLAPGILQGESPVGDDRWGAFRNRRDAVAALRRMAEEHGLCLQRLGLESGKGSCFGHQIGRCRGVCAGAETDLQHDLRLAQALQSVRIASWPYPGPIGIREGENGREVLHLVDRWAWLGTAASPEEVQEKLQADVEFDLDIYRLLHSALARPRKYPVVHALSAWGNPPSAGTEGPDWPGP